MPDLAGFLVKLSSRREDPGAKVSSTQEDAQQSLTKVWSRRESCQRSGSGLSWEEVEKVNQLPTAVSDLPNQKGVSVGLLASLASALQSVQMLASKDDCSSAFEISAVNASPFVYPAKWQVFKAKYKVHISHPQPQKTCQS